MSDHREVVGPATLCVSRGPAPPFPGEVVLEREIPSDEALVPALVVRTCEYLRNEGFFVGGEDEGRLALGLQEALRNAVVHGNRSDFEKQVTLRVLLGDSEWGWMVSDHGDGFDPGLITHALEGSAVWENRGRGIPLIQHVMERVQYYDGGRTVLAMARL